MPRDAFALRLQRELIAKHLGVHEEQVPDDVVDLWDAMAASADTLDPWYAAGEPPRGRRHLLRISAPTRGTAVP